MHLVNILIKLQYFAKLIDGSTTFPSLHRNFVDLYQNDVLNGTLAVSIPDRT